MFLYFVPSLLWFFNLELNPGLRGIWIRPDSNGNKRFVLTNVIRLLIEPLKNIHMWKIKMWDINIYMFYFCCFLFYMFFEHSYNLVQSNKLTEWNKFYMKIMHL